MSHEVVVVGGGIGGLTVAALLAARGVDVCLLERQPQVGGCVSSFEKYGFRFEPTNGLYYGWNPGEIHEQVFAQLPVDPPSTRGINPAYHARLSDGSEIAVGTDNDTFNNELTKTFPECSTEAIRFYEDCLSAALLLQDPTSSSTLVAGARSGSRFQLPRLFSAGRLKKFQGQTLSQHLEKTSERFKSFISLQLQTFAIAPLEQWTYLAACAVLKLARQSVFSIKGGAAGLAEQLAQSIKLSGGSIRLDTPVLRLCYDAQGQATGVDLLSGEKMLASKAIISNMTVWDTYGKLIGLQRTPADLKKQLTALSSSGAYLIFAGLDNVAASRLSSDRFLVATQSGQTEGLVDTSAFALNAAPEWDSRAPEGKRAVTISFRADVNDWFSYQSDATEQEERDQTALEIAWKVLHECMPELGSDIEVIETATPQTYYELTRRKLGMVGGLGRPADLLDVEGLRHRTILPNVFIVGDTVSAVPNLASVSHSALTVANEIAVRN